MDGQPQRMADEPDFVGTITSVSQSPADNNDVVGRILVASSRREPVGILGDEASITITDATPIWRCDNMSTLVPSSFAELVTGGYVSVWVDGPVAESYPVQAKASAVKTLSSGCD